MDKVPHPAFVVGLIDRSFLRPTTAMMAVPGLSRRTDTGE